MRRNTRGTWSFRRGVVMGTLSFCAFCVGWCMILGAADVETGKTIVASAFALAGGVIGSYVFAATWNDQMRPPNGN